MLVKLALENFHSILQDIYEIYNLATTSSSGFSMSAQDISGIWQGKLTMEPLGCFHEYYIELQIKTFNRDFEGISYDYYDTTKFVKLEETLYQVTNDSNQDPLNFDIRLNNRLAALWKLSSQEMERPMKVFIR